MELGVVGSGPAFEALQAACEDVDLSVQQYKPTALGDSGGLPPTGAVVAPAGARVFEAATTTFERWVAVEIGGVGGRALEAIDATVSLYEPEAGCYQCLCRRVAANADSEPAESARGSRSEVRLAGAVAGRELIGLLAGDRSGGRVIEIPWRERRLLAVPGCECEQSRPDRQVSLSYRSVGLEDALARGETAVDDRLGLLSQVGERESFPVPYYIAQTADTSGFSDVQAAQFAAGVDADWNRSYMKAIGEGLERYCAGVYRRSDLRGRSEQTLANPVSPQRFVRPESHEHPDSQDRLEWIDGVDLQTGQEVTLPAEFVCFPPLTRRYRPAITTGLGLGNSTLEAVLSGLYEVIERDGTMIGWYSTFEPLGLTLEDAVFADLEKRASAESLTVTPLLVTQDIDIPVVAVAVHRDGEWPNFAIGSGANLDPTAAARSALAEALQNWMELRAMGSDQAAEEKAAIGEYADFPEPAQQLVDLETRIPIDSLGEPDLSGEPELEAVCERLAAVGLDSYAARLTTRDVEALGFEAFRVVVPSAQPLFTGEPYFGERARSVPESLGFEADLARPYHPYP